jgi:hypothetical protein
MFCYEYERLIEFIWLEALLLGGLDVKWGIYEGNLSKIGEHATDLGELAGYFLFKFGKLG